MRKPKVAKFTSIRCEAFSKKGFDQSPVYTIETVYVLKDPSIARTAMDLLVCTYIYIHGGARVRTRIRGPFRYFGGWGLDDQRRGPHVKAVN